MVEILQRYILCFTYDCDNNRSLYSKRQKRDNKKGSDPDCNRNHSPPIVSVYLLTNY